MYVYAYTYICVCVEIKQGVIVAGSKDVGKIKMKQGTADVHYPVTQLHIHEQKHYIYIYTNSYIYIYIYLCLSASTTAVDSRQMCSCVAERGSVLQCVAE